MLALRQEVFLGRHAEPHRAARHTRQQDRYGLGLAVVLRPVPGAEIGHADPDTVLRIQENPRQFLTQRERVLRAGPQFDDLAIHPGDGHERLQMEMLVPRKHEPVFEDVIAVFENGGVAGFIREPVAVIAPDAPGTACTLAIVRNDSHRFVFEQLRRGICHRVFHGGNHRQHVVFDRYPFERRDRLNLGFGRDGGDGVADIADLVDRDDWLVLDEIPVSRVQSGKVVPRDNGMDTRHAPRRRGVDRNDPRMGMGRSQDLGVQHSGERNIDGIRRGSRGLGDRIGAGEILSDDVKYG